MLRLKIINVRIDPKHRFRMISGNFKINKELNQEWIDIQNTGTETINLQGRVLASCNPKANKNVLSDVFPQRALIRSSSLVPLYPTEIVRIFTGEQPYESTYIPDEDNISRVVWLRNQYYLWTDQSCEARLYLDMETLRSQNEPLATYCYNPWF